METYSLSIVVSFSFRSTFTRVLISLCFTVGWSVRPVLMYLRKPMLATRCVENLLRECSLDMIL